MRKWIIASMLALTLTACGALGARTNPDTGATEIYSTETGEVVPAGGVVGGIVGTATGNPAIGLAAGGLATALLAAFLKKKSPSPTA